MQPIIKNLPLHMIHQISPGVWEVPLGFIPDMKVRGIFYGSQSIADMAIFEASEWMKRPEHGIPAILQIAYVARMAGISIASFAMPDLHSGYGFSIGAVAAFNISDPNAVISPGGIGYDINCGIRCLATNLNLADFLPRRSTLLDSLCRNIPSGVGGTRKGFATKMEIDHMMKFGAKWCVDNEYGEYDDLLCCEEGGCLPYADNTAVSNRAIARGIDHVGTLGSGNHFLEIQVIDEIFDQNAARAMGLEKGNICVMMHTGSRGIGYQVADDFLSKLPTDPSVPDRQLLTIPYHSKTGKLYMSAMAAASNFAFANRQIITHFIRESFYEVFEEFENLTISVVYDVAHNIAKLEKHGNQEYIVHRKGATRALGPSHRDLPYKYRGIGQPVPIGGSMGTASYILVGTDQNENMTFSSTCHGAGRAMSRSMAGRSYSTSSVSEHLADIGVEVRAAGSNTISEEAPETYKNIEDIVMVCESVGLSRKVARLRPLGVLKG